MNFPLWLSRRNHVDNMQVSFLTYGFIESPSNRKKPMCFVCMIEHSNESIRANKLQYNLESKHKDKKYKPLYFLKKLRDDFKKKNTISSFFNSCQDKKDLA